jgi:hypothetical protein
MPSHPPNVVRVAHAYGNTDKLLDTALASDVDMIEADMWLRGGRLHLHHEHHLGWLPLLIDMKMPTHTPGRFAVPIGKYVVRPRIGTLSLDRLFKRVDGAKRLLLDVKGQYKPRYLETYVESLVRTIREYKAESWAVVCGQTYSVLHRLREVAPDIEVRYSIEHPYQWERFEKLRTEGVRKICIWHRFLDEERAAVLRTEGVDVYCWTVDDPAVAGDLVNRGVDGIISNDLDLLSALPRVTSGSDAPLMP